MSEFDVVEIDRLDRIVLAEDKKRAHELAMARVKQPWIKFGESALMVSLASAAVAAVVTCAVTWAIVFLIVDRGGAVTRANLSQCLSHVAKLAASR